MKIGVWDRSTPGWTSGSEYTRAQAATLLSVRDEFGIDLSIVAEAPDRQHLTIAGSLVPITAQPTIGYGSLINREVDRFLRKSKLGAVSQLRRWRDWLARLGFDVLLSFEPPNRWWEPSDVAASYWIWDFQHSRMPEMFADRYRRTLDERFRRDVGDCDLAVVSSEASRRDFLEFMPEFAEKVRIYGFPSRFSFESELTVRNDLETVLRKYHLDREFFLVVNQFWKHKNHEAVVEAARILKHTVGSSPQIVMIGSPFDDRDPGGLYISNLLSRVAEYGLEGRVKMLGFVSGEERDALLRSCTALVQPSRFEGWNTSIEDAKAIGRPIIASGLDVHREQAPDAIGFFDVDDHAGLADLLAQATGLPAGPDPDTEHDALARACFARRDRPPPLLDLRRFDGGGRHS